MVRPEKKNMKDEVKRPTAIVFDFGNVLIDWDPRYLYRKLLDGDEQAVERFLKEVNFFEWNLQQDAGRPLHTAILELCDRYPQHCDLIRAYDERYEESISGPIWPTVEILGELKAVGYPLYGLSNWPAEKWRQFSPKHAFFSWFDDIVISGEVGLAKPDPAIFHLLLERNSLVAAECLLIDDIEHNILAARELGFQAIQFRSPQQLRQALEQCRILENAPSS
jgi:2-haloacid dehalogenase